ncbi:uncharacterized protein [Macrobrachium rosenbergii]|uniref:uncharacterized protein n=1 Tax=Macrobrachium rosenbergii TaxID=79674 RepID=UPI0034D3B0BB
MRISWILFGALLFVALVGTKAGPVEFDENNNDQPGGSKTWTALKNFFRPVTNYFKGLPEKTPSDVATDVKETVTDVKEWAQENQAIQTLMQSLIPVKNWLKEKADVLQDKTFKEMYDDVKTRVVALDDHIGQWIQERNKKAELQQAL